MAVSNGNTATKVVTGKVRLSYANLFVPVAINGEGEPKYSVSLLIPKSDTATLDKILKAINAAAQAGLTTKFGGKLPPNMKTPLRDGDIDRPDEEAYVGHYFMNASAKLAPGVVDRARNPVMSQDDVYSGCYALASVNFYAFNTSGNKGIACGLNNIMKVADGVNLGGRASAESDFADVELDDDIDFLS